MAIIAGSLQFWPLRDTTARYPCQKCNVNYQLSGLTVKATSARRNPSKGDNSSKRTWRQRKLSPDKRWPRRKRIPFLEEQEMMIRDNSYLVEIADIGKLLNETDDRFQLILELAAEATEFQVKNKSKLVDIHPLSKAISDRMNEDEFKRPEGYDIDESYGLIPDTAVRLTEP